MGHKYNYIKLVLSVPLHTVKEYKYTMKAKSKLTKKSDLNKITFTLAPKDKTPMSSYIEIDGKELTVQYADGKVQMSMPPQSNGVGLWGRVMGAYNALVSGQEGFYVSMSPQQAQSVMNALRRHLKTVKALSSKSN